MGNSKTNDGKVGAVDVTMKEVKARKYTLRASPDDVLLELEEQISISNHMINACNERAQTVEEGSAADKRIERMGKLWCAIRTAVESAILDIEDALNKLYGCS